MENCHVSVRIFTYRKGAKWVLKLYTRRMRHTGFKYGYRALALLLLVASGTIPKAAMSEVAAGKVAVNGFLVFPPESGSLQLTANVDGQAHQIASAQVKKDGAFTIELPAQVVLPQQANVQDIPVVPELKFLGMNHSKCKNQLQVSDQKARVIWLDAGRFVTNNGKTIGQAVLGTTAVAGRTAQFSTYVYAFADRVVQVGGHLDCQYMKGNQKYKASIDVRYHLKPGWNVLLRQSVRKSGSDEFETTAKTLSKQPAMNWRYQTIQ